MLVKVNLNKNYKLVQEGERILEITDAKVTPSGKPNKLVLNMKDIEDGASLQNSYNFDNDTSLWAMGVMLSTALGLKDGDDFDTNDISKLIGIKLKCEIVHSEYNDRTYANVKKVLERVDVEDSTGVVSNEMSGIELQNAINTTLYHKRSDLYQNDLD